MQTFQYDSLNRITEAKETNGTQNGTQNWKQTYDYDRFGNRTNFSQIVGTQQLTVNNQTLPSVNPNTNRFNENQGYVFDKGGNIVQDVNPLNNLTRNFTFDGNNKQTRITDSTGVVGEYFYDGEGKRVKKKTQTELTIFVYSNGKLIAEYSTATPTLNPTINYTATDTLGSPRVLTDAIGQVKSRRDFMPFGEEIGVNTPQTTGRSSNLQYNSGDNVRQKFTGYQKDAESNLDFAEARYYNSNHGRFTAVDPLLASGKSANPQTFNRFVYCLNRPMDRVDPTGLQVAQKKPGEYETNNYRGQVFYNPNATNVHDRYAGYQVNKHFKELKQTETHSVNGGVFTATRNGWNMSNSAPKAALQGVPGGMGNLPPEIVNRMEDEVKAGGNALLSAGRTLLPAYCKVQFQIPILSAGITGTKDGNIFIGGSAGINDQIKSIIPDKPDEVKFPKFSIRNNLGVSCGYYFTTSMNSDERDSGAEGPDFEVQVPLGQFPASATFSQSLDGDPPALEIGTPGFGFGTSYTSKKLWDWKKGLVYTQPNNQ